MVLSYTTSPAYHLIAEDDDTKAAAPFTEGHYLQIEVAAKVASSDQPELADQFLEFMLSDAFQGDHSDNQLDVPCGDTRGRAAARLRHADLARNGADVPGERGGCGPRRGVADMADRADRLNRLPGLIGAGIVLLVTLGSLAAVMLRAEGLPSLGPCRLGRGAVHPAAGQRFRRRFSVLLAIPVARALARRRFPGRARAGHFAGRAVHPAGDRGGAGSAGGLRAHRADQHRSGLGSVCRRSRSTGCTASCWRMCSSTCRWPRD